MDYSLLRRKVGTDGVASLLGKRVSALLVPVFITMLIVSWSAINLSIYLNDQQINSFFEFINENSKDSVQKKIGTSLVNALIAVSVVVIMTFFMVLLYRYHCEKIIFGMLMISVGSALFYVMWIWLDLFCTRFQIPYDFITAAFLLWNIGVVGVVSIFYYSHPGLAQVYLVVVSIVVGWSLSFLPEWTTWSILIIIALYDVVAVICPWGPLRMLIEIADRRNESIPGFLYDTTNKIALAPSSINSIEGTNGDMSTNDAPRRKSIKTPSLQVRRQMPPAYILYYALYRGPFKLGLGDFVFYSLLSARAALYSFLPWVMSTMAVVFGLVATLASLVLFRDKIRALPALPISICFGVIVFFLCRYVIVPFDWFATASMLAL